ncbi:MAG: ECF transporter S component [Candidatus Methanosuratus sp.]|nr:ECF transporter S component [Candidatus Methanosuratincola sp.]
MRLARDIPITAFSTALVAVATIAFTIYVPATRGYFNLGEAAVFLVALLGGARIGAFAGGVGSMLADVVLGFYLFAPATLVIKGLEGFLLGILTSRRPEFKKGEWKLLSIAASAAVFTLVLAVGIMFYSGTLEVTIGPSWIGSYSLVVELSPIFWAIVGGAVALVVAYASLSARQETGYITISALISGSVMVLGYFLYEQLFLGYAAIAEVPFNIGQVLVGIIIAIPAYTSLKVISRSPKQVPSS